MANSTDTSASEDRLAARCAKALFDRDRASQALGMRIVESAVGRSVVSMEVRDDMTNGHGTCHGGFIYSLADSAFAFACNSRNRVNVALNCTIDYLRPAQAGDVLVAEAIEVQRGGRTALVEIDVRDPDDKLVARFRGRSYQLDQPVLAD